MPKFSLFGAIPFLKRGTLSTTQITPEPGNAVIVFITATQIFTPGIDKWQFYNQVDTLQATYPMQPIDLND